QAATPAPGLHMNSGALHAGPRSGRQTRAGLTGETRLLDRSAMRVSAQWKSFIPRALGADTVPHLACGLARDGHLTLVAGRRSAAAVVVAWGALSLGAGLMLVRRAAAGSGRWDRRLVWFEGGALAFTAWMAISEAFGAVNSDL